jgi:hypothetical protein
LGIDRSIYVLASFGLGFKKTKTHFKGAFKRPNGRFKNAIGNQLFRETQTPTGFLIDTKEYIDYSMVQPAGLVLVELLCCQPCLAVVLQSGVKDKCYCTVYYIPLNSNFKS